MSSSHSLGIMKRDIANFTGNILVIAGMQDDYNRYKYVYEIPEPNTLIYQTNIKDDATVDYVVDCTQAHAFDKFGSRKFDIIYFAGMTCSSDMITAITNSISLLSPNGILLYRGSFVAVGSPTVLNLPKIFSDSGLHNITIAHDQGARIIGFKNPKMQLDKSILLIPNINVVLVEVILRELGNEKSLAWRHSIRDLIKNPQQLLAMIQEILKPCDPKTYQLPPMQSNEFLMRTTEFDEENFQDKRIQLARKFVLNLQKNPRTNIITIPELFQFIETSLRSENEDAATYFSEDFFKSKTSCAEIFQELLTRNSQEQLLKRPEMLSAAAPQTIFNLSGSSGLDTPRTAPSNKNKPQSTK